MDARSEAQPQSTHFFGTTRRVEALWGTLRYCAPLVWMTKRRVAHLALRPTAPQRGVQKRLKQALDHL
jgi:hypothetical protein